MPSMDRDPWREASVDLFSFMEVFSYLCIDRCQCKGWTYIFYDRTLYWLNKDNRDVNPLRVRRCVTFVARTQRGCREKGRKERDAPISAVYLSCATSPTPLSLRAILSSRDIGYLTVPDGRVTSVKDDSGASASSRSDAAFYMWKFSLTFSTDMIEAIVPNSSSGNFPSTSSVHRRSSPSPRTGATVQGAVVGRRLERGAGI
ncbi:hypothetical protein CBL_13062 [Carabus blaptoides fortunei]